jgi:hypothetical protein
MYRPEEEVHLKGWVRTLSAGPTGDVRLDAGSGALVDYLVTDPQGNQLAQGSAPMTDLGGFDLAFTIPQNSNLGYASVQLSTRNTPVFGSYYHSFQIQEFRRPEFEVTARNESTGPYFLGDDAISITPAARCPAPRRTGQSAPAPPITRRQTGMNSSLASGRRGGGAATVISTQAWKAVPAARATPRAPTRPAITI